MAEYVQDDQGQTWAKMPGNKWIPIEPKDAAIIEEGGFEAFARSAGTTLSELPLGIGALAGVAGAQERLNEGDRQQAIRSQANPAGQIAGVGAGLIPDVAVGVLSGGTSIPAQIGRAALTEGVLGAVRNPENPVQGGLTQGAFGAVGGGAGAIIGRGAQAVGRRLSPQSKSSINSSNAVVRNSRRTTDLENGRVNDGINAQRVDSPSFERIERSLAGLKQGDELDELALDLGTGRIGTKAQRRQLDARAGSEEVAASKAARETEELFASNVALDRVAGKGGGGINAMNDNAKEAGTKLVLRELGEETGGMERMTWANMEQVEEKLVQPFKDAAEAAGDLKFLDTDLDELADVARLVEPDNAGVVKGYTDTIAASIDDAGSMNQQAAWDMRNRLSKDIMKAGKAGQMARVESLSSVREVVDDIIERQIPGEVSEALADARHKYRVLKSLQRTTATTSGDSTLNIRSFMNAWQKSGNNRFGRSSKRSEDFNRNLETLNFLQQKITPSSGTAQRLIAGAASGPVAGALGGGAVAAGLIGD